MKKRFFLYDTIRKLLLTAGGFGVTLLALTIAVPANTQPAATPRLAIVIDDFGQDRRGVDEMLKLPLEITCAIMPNMEYTQQDAANAIANGKEVIVHMPMQANTSDPMSWYGPEPILLWHTYEQAHAIAERAVWSVPNAVGMNIHIGSESSEREHLVQAVVDVCKDAGFYFLDSLTSQKSVCEKVATQCGVPFLVRQVFLEHDSRTKAHVKKQLERAVEIAKTRGYCVCIGHVGPEGGINTAEAIREMIPYFEEQGVEVVFASRLLSEPVTERTDDASGAFTASTAQL